MSDIMHECFMAGKRGQELRKRNITSEFLASAHLFGIAQREFGKLLFVEVTRPTIKRNGAFSFKKDTVTSFNISYRGANYREGKTGAQTFFDVRVSYSQNKRSFQIDCRTDDPYFPKITRRWNQKANQAAYSLGLIARRYSPV